VILIVVTIAGSFRSHVKMVTRDAVSQPPQRTPFCPESPPISTGTEERIIRMFAPEDQQRVRKILLDDVGNNLPFCHDPQEMDRIRFAVLKIAKGRIDKLEKAVDLLKTDWRDVLAGAGFAWNPTKHKSWMPHSRMHPTMMSRLRRWFSSSR